MWCKLLARVGGYCCYYCAQHHGGGGLRWQYPLSELRRVQSLTGYRHGSLPSCRALSSSSPILTMLCPPGLDIHFIHVKPPQLPAGRTPKPLLMVHGWPGSFYEFYHIIPLLTDPKNHGLSDEHVFEVICPSIPGYGYSEASSKKGKGAAGGGPVPSSPARASLPTGLPCWENEAESAGTPSLRA